MTSSSPLPTGRRAGAMKIINPLSPPFSKGGLGGFGGEGIAITNQSIIITTSIDKIPPTLPFPKGGVTPLWQRGARGDFQN